MYGKKSAKKPQSMMMERKEMDPMMKTKKKSIKKSKKGKK